MARQGCDAVGPYVATPVTMPIIDLPSTSSQNNQTPKKCPPKLPLYGQLNITDYEEFMREQKVYFHERYKHKQSCVRLSSMKGFQYLYILGRGDFSKTVAAQRKSEDYALKIYKKHVLVKNNLVEKVLEEKRILQSLDSPFCIRLEYLYQDTFELIFFLPYLSGGELFTQLQRNSKFDERMSRFYAAQVFLALEYLHHCDLVHRELKPESLLLDHVGYLKIAEFGSAKIVTTRTYTFCGTPEYVAPEMIAGKGYGKSVDWWAFGVLLFEMNAGYPPFISPDIMKTYANITAAHYTVPSGISGDLQDLIHKLLQPDVSSRLGNLKRGPEDVKLHKWFTGVNWLKLVNRREEPPYLPGKRRTTVKYPTLAGSSGDDHQETNVDEYFKDF